MTYGSRITLAVLAAAIALVAPYAARAAQAPKRDEIDQKALDAIRETVKAGVKDPRWLAANLAELERLRKLDEKILSDALPKFRFYFHRRRMYPVARMVPGPLSGRDLFAVEPKVGEAYAVDHITQPKALVAFCKKHLRATDEKAARVAAHAYALLRKELVQDGFFRFEIKPEEFQVQAKPDSIVVQGSIRVPAPAPPPGPRPMLARNSGSIDFTLAFEGKDGAFKLVSEKSTLRAGMRPICQSLKLLDADPTVRAAAERALLWMGRNALPYLRMQAGRTKGDLQRAIRDLTRRIEAGEHIEGGQPEAN